MPSGSFNSDPVTVNGVGGWGNVGTFTTYVPPPPTPPRPVWSAPSEPLNVAAVPGDAQATVSWSAPLSSGSGPVSSYSVRATPGGATCTATALSCTVTGLTNGTAYTFEVQAYNSAWGPWSPPSTAVTPRAVPVAPRDVRAIAGNAKATVTWAPLSSEGPATAYEVSATPVASTCETTATTCEMTGLVNGTSYTFTVRAKNAFGWGPWSAPSNAVTPVAPTIAITGTRGTGRESRTVFVSGKTTGLAGERVRAHVKVRGQSSYREGREVIVRRDGTFAWQRQAGRKIYVYFTGGGAQSNRVIIPRR